MFRFDQRPAVQRAERQRGGFSVRVAGATSASRRFARPPRYNQHRARVILDRQWAPVEPPVRAISNSATNKAAPPVEKKKTSDLERLACANRTLNPDISGLASLIAASFHHTALCIVEHPSAHHVGA
jgi:hypothetical protein